MKVKDIIRQLEERYDPDAELVIVWWDQQNFTDPRNLDTDTDVVNPPTPLWNAAVHKIDNDGLDAVDGVYDVIQNIIDEVSRPEDGR